MGNVTQVEDDDSRVLLGHDAVDRVITSQTVDLGSQPAVTLTSLYNMVGDQVSLADSLGGQQTMLYDGAARLTRLTTTSGGAIDLSYDLAGRLTGTTRPNGTSSTHSYDAAGRLAGLLHSLGVSDFLDLGFGYDAAGNITAITEPGEVRSFGYDDLNRLVTAGTAALPESYGYDPAGNRTVSHRSNSHSHDDANRLLEDQQFLYLYDLNGNLTAKTDKATSDLTSYSYDAQNQLTRIDFPGGGYAEYKYDGLGRRIEKDVDGTITRYVYDGTDIVMTFDDLGVLQARVNHGDRVDQPLFMARGGQATYYHGDHLGSVRALSDAGGAVVNSYAYDAFGNTTAARSSG